MLVELRIYTYHPGRLQPLLPVIEKEVLPIQLRHFGRLLGYYVSDSGTLNQTTQVWAFDDAGDRERRRAALAADPEWQAVAARLVDAVQSQESRLLRRRRQYAVASAGLRRRRSWPRLHSRACAR